MLKNKKRGFGLGSLIVIVALVLIVGTYMYYKGDNAAPVIDPDSEMVYPPTAPEVPVGQMELGEEATDSDLTASTTPVEQ